MCAHHTIQNTDNWKEVEEFAKKALPEHIVTFIEECRKDVNPESKLIKSPSIGSGTLRLSRKDTNGRGCSIITGSYG